MPPLISAVTSWIVGLFLGTGWGQASASSAPAQDATVGVVLLGSVAAATLWVLCRGAPASFSQSMTRALVPLALVAGGVMVAYASARERQLCRSRITAALNSASSASMLVDEAVREGGYVRGRVALRDGSGCTDVASLRVKSGTLTAGARAEITGTALATDRGVRIEGSIGARSASQDPLRRWRDRAGTSIDSLFRSQAALVRALLIADQDGISPDIRDRFADAGLVHMLSVSGMHVAIIASALLTLASSVRLSRTAASWAALGLVLFYIAMLGAPAPAVRSGVMLAVVMISERLQRPVHPWTALALGAVIPTYDPLIVVDLGWQLSVSGMAALVAARSLFRRWREVGHATPGFGSSTGHPYQRWLRARGRASARWFASRKGFTRHLVRESLTGIIATAVTAPLIAWIFGRVSLMAPLTNLAAGPIVAFVQPALFLALLLAPWHAAGQLVADACQLPLALLYAVADVGATVPFAVLRTTPTLATAVACGVASAALVRATAARRAMPWMLAAAGALLLAAWIPLLPVQSGYMEVHMLDVGQGDALAIRTPRGRWILVDAGRRWDGGDAGRRTIIPYLQRIGGPVGLFVLSHAHEDHAGGAASIMEALTPLQWWEPAFVTTSIAYENALRVAQSKGVLWQRVHPGQRWQIDGIRVEVLAPDSAWTARQRDANETSVVLRVQYGRRSVLLMGDAEAHEEAWLVEHVSAGLLQADVLKLGHHGSRTSSTAPFVGRVQPLVGLVSVGAGNRYGHPSPEVLERFADAGIPLLRTDREGPVVVRTDGRSLEVHAGGARWQVAPRAPVASERGGIQ